MTAGADRPLPSFRKPPLHEVALSVQFESLPDLTAAHIGQFWGRLRKRFPIVEEQPPLPPIPIERDGVHVGQELVISTDPPRPRIWLLDSERRELIQIQHDRFTRNWRKSGTEDRYPRYEDHIRPNFEHDYQAFCDFVRDEGIGDVNVLQCEVSYFNQIRTVEGVWTRPDDMHHAFCLYDPVETGSTAVSLEGFQLRQSFRMTAENEFKGRLYAEIGPGQVGGESVIQYHLTARGHPGTNSAEDALAFLDLGRESIVRYFAASTSPAMRQEWEIE